MPRREVLVDASVALKWFVPEADSGRASALIAIASIGTTTLAEYEIGNTLARRVEFEAGYVERSLEALRRICGEPESFNAADSVTTIELCRTYGLTFYDASYAAIAQRTGRTLVSADSDLLSPGLAVSLDDLDLG